MKKIIISIVLIIILLPVFSQPQVSIDGIVAIIGKEIIMRSDVENTFIEYMAQQSDVGDERDIKCDIFERLVFQKLLLHQAALDSIIITDQQVEDQVNYRINYVLQQSGGDPKMLEDYYKKSLSDIKKDMKPMMREQMMVDEVQRSITENTTITPTEVKKFFENIPYDSLPTIAATYEFGHIVKTPHVSETEIAAIKQRLNEYRERVLRGEKFSMLARLYSDDPGSASKGGNLGFVEKGTLYPEFEAAAFNLKTGEISPVIQTKAGYHIIQMIERRGDRINVSHILLQPKPSTEAQVEAIEYLDSVRKVIIDNKMNFSDAAFKFSDDMNKNSGGWVVNPYTGSNKFEKEAIDQTTFVTLSKLIPGEYSDPSPYVNDAGNMCYRLLYLKTKTPPHKPNLIEDYDMIKNAAIESKKEEVIDKWVEEKVQVTSIKITGEYKNCPFVSKWKIPNIE